MIALPTPTHPNLLVAWTIYPDRFYLNIFSKDYFHTYQQDRHAWSPDTDELPANYLAHLNEAHAGSILLFSIPTAASTPAEVELFHPELFL